MSSKNNNEIDVTVYVGLKKDSLKNIAILFLILTMVILLFVDGGMQQNHRLVKDVWNAGHLGLFGLLSFSYFCRPATANHSLIYKIVFITIASLSIGAAVEVIQLLFDRSFSVNDIANDVIGGYLGLLGLIIFNHQKTITFRTIASIIFILLLVLGLRGFEKHLYDEVVMQKQFPVLAGFENQIEMERWDFSRVNVKRSQQFVKSGKYSLEVEYLPGSYPTISLQHLKSDWSGYSKLMFSVYSPSHQNQNFVVKVFDKNHIKNGFEYSDRFNGTLTLKYGWNDIQIAIADIIKAPRKRIMDIHEIKMFSLFTDNLEQSVTIYIDDIRLM